MEFENILKLVESVSRSELDSFLYEENGMRIKLTKKEKVVQAAPLAAPSEERGAMPSQMLSANDTYVNSPLVGVFYAAPAEDAAPYVTVGDRVKKGQVLCIVEAMKLMNEIESEEDGVIKEICVTNGNAVEFGQPLFVIAKE